LGGKFKKRSILKGAERMEAGTAILTDTLAPAGCASDLLAANPKSVAPKASHFAPERILS